MTKKKLLTINFVAPALIAASGYLSSSHEVQAQFSFDSTANSSTTGIVTDPVDTLLQDSDGNTVTQKIRTETEDGKKVYKSDDAADFIFSLYADLENLKKTDAGAARSVEIGIAQIIVFKELEVTIEEFVDGRPDLDLLENLDIYAPASQDQLFNNILDRMDNGVTMDSIVQIGKQHQKNAATKYENAAQEALRSLKDKIGTVKDNKREIESLIGRVSLIDPKISASAEGKPRLVDIQLLNESGIILKSVEIEINTNGRSKADPLVLMTSPDGRNDKNTATVLLEFKKGILPGEFRTITNLPIKILSGKLPDRNVKSKEVVATVTVVTEERGWKFTGSEYDPLLKSAKLLERDLENFIHEAERTLANIVRKWSRH